MTDDRKAAIALIAGSLMGLVTMHIHPSGAVALATEAQVAQLALASAVAHSLALLGVVLLFLGACGLTKLLAGSDRISFAAIVVYAFACVTISIAAAISGFVIPGIVKQMVRGIAADAHQWRIVMAGIFQINQSMAQIFSVGSSLAIILWSVSILRTQRLRRALGIYGLAAAVAVIVAILVGLRLDLRGMTAIMLAQAIWFLAAGVQMWAPRSAGTSL